SPVISPPSLHDALPISCLLPDSVERVLDRRLRRAAHFEFRNHAIDAFDVGIDGLAVVAAHRNRKRNVSELSGKTIVERLAVDHRSEEHTSELQSPCNLV